MESLPQLALDLVCEHLELSDPHRVDLLAFSSVSRLCRAAAWRARFSQVTVDIDDPKFHKRLERLECMLNGAKARACVKVLKLGIRNHNRTERAANEVKGPYVSWTKLGPDFHPIRPLREWKPMKELRPDEHWQHLARFISSLQLKELIWASTEQLPPCILVMLNEQMPACRLHVHGFDLRSLHQRDALQDIEETEYMLATSPCLYSIHAPYSMFDESGCANYNGEAILQLSTGLAPNLKYICIWQNSTMPSGEIRSRRNARLKWRGFHPQSKGEWREIPKTKGQIQSLAIDALYSVTGFQLESWECHTDFSFLQSLHLARQIDLDVLKKLADLCRRWALPLEISEPTSYLV